MMGITKDTWEWSDPPMNDFRDQTPPQIEGSPDEWYEREKAAFISWWESEGEKKFGATPTLAAGAGWFARAERVK
jgi:hypothetical protein